MRKISHIFIAKSSIRIGSSKETEMYNVSYKSISCLLAPVTHSGVFIPHTGERGNSNTNQVLI